MGSEGGHGEKEMNESKRQKGAYSSGGEPHSLAKKAQMAQPIDRSFHKIISMAFQALQGAILVGGKATGRLRQ